MAVEARQLVLRDGMCQVVGWETQVLRGVAEGWMGGCGSGNTGELKVWWAVSG